MRSICKLRNSSSIIIHYIIIQSNSCIKYHSYFQNYEPQKTFIFQWRNFNSIRKFTHDYAEIFHDFNTIFSLSISPLSLSRLSLILTEITITFQAIKHFWLGDISWLYNFIRDTIYTVRCKQMSKIECILFSWGRQTKRTSETVEPLSARTL